MKIRFILNGLEFECEFSDVQEMLMFIRNLTHNNRGKVRVISFSVESVVYIINN